MSGCCEDIKVIETPDGQTFISNVIGLGDIKVQVINESGAQVAYVSLNPYTPPIINATANPYKEVGSTFSFQWSVSIVPGRENITDRSISPVPTADPVLTAPFVVDIVAQKITSRQVKLYHTVTATDTIPTTTTKQLSINAVNKVFMGYSYKDGVSAGQILSGAEIAAFTGTLTDNIKSQYGGLKTYNIPVSGALLYPYWAYEVGTTPINSMKLSDLPFPLTFIPGTTGVVNPHDGAITTQYVLVRATNKFGTGSLSLEMF